MDLVIGGAYQGKTEYARRTFQKERILDGSSAKIEELSGCDGITAFHEFLKRVMRGEFETTDVLKFDADLTKMELFAKTLTAFLLEQNPSMVIISNELGYGIVPMVREDRMWRELCGRVCTELAAEADSVTRVVCGLGMRLK